jgi:hypothetical protein
MKDVVVHIERPPGVRNQGHRRAEQVRPKTELCLHEMRHCCEDGELPPEKDDATLLHCRSHCNAVGHES